MKLLLIAVIAALICANVASANCNTFKSDFSCINSIDVKVSSANLAKDYIIANTGKQCVISSDNVTKGFQIWSCGCAAPNNVSLCGNNLKSNYNIKMQYYLGVNDARIYEVNGVTVKSDEQVVEEAKQAEQIAKNVQNFFIIILVIIVLLVIGGIVIGAFFVKKFLKGIDNDE